MRILIVDDDSVARSVLRRALERVGHEVQEAPDGSVALEMLLRQSFPVVISDWMMPGTTGPDLCRAIRASEARRMAQGQGRRYTYVMLLTSLEGKANTMEGMEAGADDFLTKPFDRELLQARLLMAERVLGLREELHRLTGLLPICAYCKRIREGEMGDITPPPRWTSVEAYVSRRSEASFTHSVCPECYDTQLKPQIEALRGLAPPG